MRSFLLVVLAFTLACASGINARIEDRKVSVLTVHNDWQETIRVYVAMSGTKTRSLGTVDMKSTARFLLYRSDMPNESLQLYVLDRLSGFALLTESITMTSGQQKYTLDFGPLRTQAFLYPSR